MIPIAQVVGDKPFYAYLASATLALAGRQAAVLRELLRLSSQEGGQEECSEAGKEAHRQRALKQIQGEADKEKWKGSSMDC